MFYHGSYHLYLSNFYSTSYHITQSFLGKLTLLLGFLSNFCRRWTPEFITQPSSPWGGGEIFEGRLSWRLHSISGRHGSAASCCGTCQVLGQQHLCRLFFQWNTCSPAGLHSCSSCCRSWLCDLITTVEPASLSCLGTPGVSTSSWGPQSLGAIILSSLSPDPFHNYLCPAHPQLASCSTHLWDCYFTQQARL